MTNPTISGFNPGGVEDRYDSRDHGWPEVGFGSSPFDWNAGFDIESNLQVTLSNPAFKIPVKDQDGSGSCGGQAWSYYAQVLEALNTKSFEERSAKYVYAQTNLPGGGSMGRDNCEVFKSQGVARESVLTSYELGKPPSEAFMIRSIDITATIRADAPLAQSFSYAQVDNNIDSVAQAIRDNNGVVLGIHGQNNGTWTSAFPKPPASNEWGHWIYAGKAKMINGVRHIGFINSWGTGVGEAGWQWLSEDWFGLIIGGYSVVFSVWVHVFNPVPVPPVFHHVFNTDLKLNMSGPEVVALQKALQVDGAFPATVPTTGFFGNITQQSVVKFQKKYNITPAAGYVGSITRKKLNELFGQ